MNSPAVVAQIAEDEALLIHFESGCYYSLNPAGTVVFDTLIERGLPVEFAMKRLSGVSEADLDRFISEMVCENLILEVEGSTNSSRDAAQDAQPASGAHETQLLEPPSLTKYSDLEDLLKLDPVHDVDASGWPVAAG